MNPVDMIDSSIFLGFIFDEDNKFKEYLNVVGYKNQNKGSITNSLMGEILTNIFVKVKDENKIEQSLLRTKVFGLLDQIMTKLIEEGKLEIIKLNKSNFDFDIFNNIKGIDYAISDDDAIHLTSAIIMNCQNFVTSDKLAENKILCEKIKSEYNLNIKKI
ncbi:hypothetical protein J4443_02305 [Candidatus Woesearchaeota archaeon]|nr:hypothetical protein [Candidatus Woesearchaeota archaeon]